MLADLFCMIPQHNDFKKECSPLQMSDDEEDSSSEGGMATGRRRRRRTNHLSFSCTMQAPKAAQSQQGGSSFWPLCTHSVSIICFPGDYI